MVEKPTDLGSSLSKDVFEVQVSIGGGGEGYFSQIFLPCLIVSWLIFYLR